jgi:hypothetical protein
LLAGLRLGGLLWQTQLRIFLNQTIRSGQAGRVVGFFAGILLVVLVWLQEAVGALLVAQPLHSLSPVALTEVFGLLFAGYALFLVFTSLLFSLNALLLNPDLEILLAAPHPVETVIAARMVVQILRMAVLSLLLTLPTLVILSLANGNLGLLPTVGLLLVLYPILVVAVISALTLALVRFVPPGRGKETLTISGIVLAVGLNLLNLIFNPAFNPGLARRAAPTLPDLSWASQPWLPSGWAGRAAAYALAADWRGAAGWGVVLLVASVAAFSASVALSGRLYLAGWLQVMPKRKRQTSRTAPARRLTLPGLDPVVTAMVAKDWRMRTRDLAQLARFAMPAIFLISIFGVRAGSLLGVVRSVGPGPIAAMIGLLPAWVLLLSLSSGLGLSSVSLEGKAIWVYAASPNDFRRFLQAKCWSAGVPTLALVLAVGVIAQILIHPGLVWSAGALAMLAAEGGAITVLMVAVGAIWARFDWTDARRMISPAAAILGLTLQLALSGATALVIFGAVGLARLVDLPLAPTWFSALLASGLTASLIAFGVLLLAHQRLRTLTATGR